MKRDVRALVASSSAAIVLYAGFCSGAAAQEPIWTSVESGVDDNFGLFAEWVGDVDHDGVRDLVTSSLPIVGTDTVRLISGRDGSTLHEWTGGDESLFGTSLSDVGDVDGDGTDDVGVVDFFVDHQDANNVSIFSGATYALLLDYTVNAQAWDVAPLGDVNQDGHDDFVVGVPAVLGHGAVRFVSGLDGSVMFKNKGGPGDRIGWCLARVPDLTGDGFPDVAAGSPTPGSSYIRLIDGHDGSTLFDVPQPAGFEEFGRVFRVLGDWDGDGVADLIVASTLAESSPGRQDGAFAIVSCADGSILHLQFGAQPGDFLGTALAALGDVNGDAIPDWALGDAAGVDFVSGRTLNVLYRWPKLYQIPSDGPDVDVDGLADFALGYDAFALAGEITARSSNDLWLHAEPETATAGDLVTFTTLENDPTLLTVRVLVEFDGTPLFLPILPLGRFGLDRQRVESFTLPPGLGAHELVYVALAQKTTKGGLRISGHETLDLE